MVIPASAFALLVGVALGITIAAPLLLLVLFIHDWKTGGLW